MDSQMPSLLDEVCLGEDIMHHSSLKNHKLSTGVLPQDEKLDSSNLLKQTLIRVTTGEGSSDPGLVRIFPMIDVSKQRTEAQWKFFGLYYGRKRKLDTMRKRTAESNAASTDLTKRTAESNAASTGMRKHTEESNAASTDGHPTNRFVNHYKRRRLFTTEISPIQLTG